MYKLSKNITKDDVTFSFTNDALGNVPDVIKYSNGVFGVYGKLKTNGDSEITGDLSIDGDVVTNDINITPSVGNTLIPATTMYFDKSYNYNPYTVSTNTTLTVSSTNGIAMNGLDITLIGGGSTSTLTISGATAWPGSDTYDDTAAKVNKLFIWYDGSTIYYKNTVIS